MCWSVYDRTVAWLVLAIIRDKVDEVFPVLYNVHSAKKFSPELKDRNNFLILFGRL